MAGKGELNEIQTFVKKRNVGAFQHVVDDANLWSAFEIRSQPSFAFINDDGTIETHLGPLGRDMLTQRVEDLIAK